MDERSRSGAGAGSSGTFSIFFLCTGNRFRSPLAAEVFRAETRGLPVEIASGGLLDVNGVGVLDEALREARRFGLDLGAHPAQAFARHGLGDFDLVVGFELAHVAAAVVEGSARRERTFTLPHLVQLLEQATLPPIEDGVARARRAIQIAGVGRGGNELRPPELADPLGRGDAFGRETARRVEDLTRRLAALLFRPAEAMPRAASHGRR